MIARLIVGLMCAVSSRGIAQQRIEPGEDPPAVTLAKPTPASPTTQPAARVAQWLDQLADPDIAMRETAKTHLASLRRSDLDTLRDLIRSRKSLTPAQIDDLRPIVEHVYLSDQPYPVRERTGFLGVQMVQIGSVDTIIDGDEERQAGKVTPSRVCISSRLPGFSAYPVLREGDIIIRVVESNVQPSSTIELAEAISELRPGQSVSLDVQRNGKVRRVAVRVSPRPMAGEFEITQFLEDRAEAARAFWASQFEPLIERGDQRDPG